MSYDADLAERMRPMIVPRAGVSEKNMFGGIAFLVNGNMCCGIHKNKLVVRMNEENGKAALKEPHTAIMDITGRPMKGWVFVLPKGHENDKDLLQWIERGYAFALSLPPKKKSRKEIKK